MRKGWIFWCLLVWLLSGCAGSASAPPRGASARAASPEVARAEAPGGFATEDSPAGAPPAESSAAAPEPQRERPGLGTEWGETRSSRVRDVAFVREDADRPFAVAQLHYDDRRGVHALAAYTAERLPLRRISTGGGAVTVSIVDEDGEPFEAVRSGDRTLVVGEAGRRYAIVLQNHTRHRFEAVATVDGLDVINGRTGALEHRGYVLMPFSSLTIDGFRQSQDAVAAFRFASVTDSYAAQTGSGRNVGVIGVAFFSESGDRFSPFGSGDEHELHLRDTASPFPADPRFAPPPRRVR